MHLHTYRNRVVLVILKDGSRFVDRFIARNSSTITFKERGRVRIKDMRAMTLRKNVVVG